MNILDNIKSYFSANAALEIAQKRAAIDVLNRSYSALSKGRRGNDAWQSLKPSAATEASHAHIGLAQVGQELCRNNPQANRLKMLAANNIVGDGIKPSIIGSNKNTSQKSNEELRKWSESTTCDFNGKNNFYGLQWLIAATVAETGGAFVIKRFANYLRIPLQLQVVEQTYLDASKQLSDNQDGSYISDGIVFNSQGQVTGYWLKPHEDRTTIKRHDSIYFPADTVCHVFERTRADQHLGLSWFAEVANKLRDRDDFKDAKLVQQKVAACFGTIITGAENGEEIGYEDSEQLAHIEPAMVQYMNEDAKVHTITPPKADNSTEFETSIDRDIATGFGVSYEQFTGDYSKVNFASGRMGRAEFFMQLDHWQQHIFKPILDKIVDDWWCNAYRLNFGALLCRVEWTYPVRASVNPKEELDVVITKTRNGIISRSKACKLYGEDWTHVNEQWRTDDEALQDNVFDNDPRFFSSAGNQLNVDDAGSANREGSVTSDSTKDKDKEDSK
jgi:lambda family phage portal protein